MRPGDQGWKKGKLKVDLPVKFYLDETQEEIEENEELTQKIKWKIMVIIIQKLWQLNHPHLMTYGKNLISKISRNFLGKNLFI